MNRMDRAGTHAQARHMTWCVVLLSSACTTTASLPPPRPLYSCCASAPSPRCLPACSCLCPCLCLYHSSGAGAERWFRATVSKHPAQWSPSSVAQNASQLLPKIQFQHRCGFAAALERKSTSVEHQIRSRGRCASTPNRVGVAQNVRVQGRGHTHLGPTMQTTHTSSTSSSSHGCTGTLDLHSHAQACYLAFTLSSRSSHVLPWFAVATKPQTIARHPGERILVDADAES